MFAPPRLRPSPLAVLALVAATVVAHAQSADDDANRPPPLDAGAGEEEAGTPADSAPNQVTAVQGQAQVSVGVLNPHMGASPLWLWVTTNAAPKTDVAVLDADGAVLWASSASAVNPRGQVVVVPRPDAIHKAELTVRILGGVNRTPVDRTLSLAHARLQQLALPILIVGGAEATDLAARLREQAPERLVHVVPSRALPVAPAAYLGMQLVVLGPDASLPPDAGLALRLFHCARRGVLNLSSSSLPQHGTCPDVATLAETGSALPGAILGGLRDFQAQLGLLEERGPPTLLGRSPTDPEAAAALMSGRPPARGAVVIMLITLALMLGTLGMSRRLRAGRSLLALAAAPAFGAVLLLLLGLAWRADADAVRLVLVDARAGSPVALLRVVDVARTPTLPQVSGRALVLRSGPAGDGGGRKSLSVFDAIDVVDVPALSVAADVQDAQRALVQAGQGRSARGWPCRTQAEAEGRDAVTTAHGRMLLSRCEQTRGAVAEMPAGWSPELDAWTRSPAARHAVSAWMYVFGG